MASNLYNVIYNMLREVGFRSKDEQKPRNHEIMTDGTISVSVPRNMKSRHTANKILKDAGIRKKENALVRRVSRRTPMRIDRFCRSTYDVFAVSRFGDPHTTIFSRPVHDAGLYFRSSPSFP